MMRIFYLIVFSLFSAQYALNQSVIRIDPERTPNGTMKMSDLIESIEYIPLETNKNCLIGDIKRNNFLKLSENYILVDCTVSQSFYLFNRSGKFIAKIGGLGGGPGEYTRYSASIFSIDEKNKQIILAKSIGRENLCQLMYYDLNGKYIRSLSVDKSLSGIFHTQFYNKYVVMHINNPFKEGDPPFSYSFFSDDYTVIKQEIKNIDYTTTRPGEVSTLGYFYHYLYGGNLHVKSAFLNDTVYSIGKDLSFFPKYIIQSGKYSLTTQILSDPDLYNSLYKNRTFFWSVFETNNYLLISYLYKEKYFFQYYDKQKNISLLFDSASGIPNDYDGGFDFWPKQQNENEYITWYNAYLFEENTNKLNPKGPQNAIENFKKITRDIDLDENPVIVIVKFKGRIFE